MISRFGCDLKLDKYSELIEKVFASKTEDYYSMKNGQLEQSETTVTRMLTFGTLTNTMMVGR